MNNKIKMPFDPIKRAEEIENIVTRETKRAYYRFRKANFYGGCITVDACGCNLLCAYCWNYARNESINIDNSKFLEPVEVAQKIKTMMQKHRVSAYRISGCEAFLGEASARHLGQIIELVDNGKNVIIETNGIMIGYKPALLDFVPKKSTIRLTIKADNDKSFEHITGARANSFEYQIDAIKTILEARLALALAGMHQFVDMSRVIDKCKTKNIKLKKATIEVEGLLYYPQNTKSMKDRGLKPIYNKAYWDAILKAE